MVDYLYSSAISFLVSVVANYKMSKKWVYNLERTVKQLSQMWMVVLLSIIGLVSDGTLWEAQTAL